MYQRFRPDARTGECKNVDARTAPICKVELPPSQASMASSRAPSSVSCKMVHCKSLSYACMDVDGMHKQGKGRCLWPTMHTEQVASRRGRISSGLLVPRRGLACTRWRHAGHHAKGLGTPHRARAQANGVAGAARWPPAPRAVAPCRAPPGRSCQEARARLRRAVGAAMATPQGFHASAVGAAWPRALAPGSACACRRVLRLVPSGPEAPARARTVAGRRACVAGAAAWGPRAVAVPACRRGAAPVLLWPGRRARQGPPWPAARQWTAYWPPGAPHRLGRGRSPARHAPSRLRARRG